MAIAKDTIFEISDYNVPKIISDADAWAEMILNLLFLENGTYSEAPELGLDLKNHTYMDTRSMIEYVKNNLSWQVDAFMPGIPLSNIDVQVVDTPVADNVLYITLAFDIKDHTIHKSAFVSLNDEIVDFIVQNYANNIGKSR
jgi:hypothetical protein